MSKLMKTATLLLLALSLILAVGGGKKTQTGETTTLLGAGLPSPIPSTLSGSTSTIRSRE